MIEAKKLSFSYSDVFHLNNLNLKVEEGKILGIIGHSGSGKTTLLKLLSGLLEPSEGELLLNGQKIDPPSKKLVPGHKKIKMVTQQNTLFPNISIYENIAYELRYFEKSYQQKRVASLSKILNISHLLLKFPRELSGGEIQRVMLAKAIADEPSVLLLDEPFANLDPIIKKKVMFTLQKVLAKEAIACIFVTHEMHDAFGMVDELLIMKNGKMIQKGTSEYIYHHPKNKYVAMLSGDGFFLQINESEEFVRPENIELKENGEFQGDVIKNVFKGPHYEVYLNFENQTIYFLSKSKFEIGQIINFEIIRPL